MTQESESQIGAAYLRNEVARLRRIAVASNLASVRDDATALARQLEERAAEVEKQR